MLMGSDSDACGATRLAAWASRAVPAGAVEAAVTPEEEEEEEEEEPYPMSGGGGRSSSKEGDMGEPGS